MPSSLELAALAAVVREARLVAKPRSALGLALAELDALRSEAAALVVAAQDLGGPARPDPRPVTEKKSSRR